MRQFLFLVFTLTGTFAGAQKEDFKVMTYNLLYYKAANAPCTSSLTFSEKDAAFKTVFKATEPDILCVNELGAYPDNSGANSILTNVINTDGEVNYTSAEYSNNGFSSITNMVFFDSTRFGLHSQSYLSNTLNNRSLARVIDFYRLYYKDPGLALGSDTVFFTVIVGHLKAGNSSPDSDDREDAAQVVMDYLANDVTDKNVILAGDLNLYGSTEGAYQEFTNYSVSTKRFVDPGVAGSWHNNSSFAPLHTQSTHAFGSGCHAGGGMDDRFDFIMHSQAIENGSAGMNYRFNSHKIIGNDGAHFNQSINAGSNTSVSATLADALYDFSDHLPVVTEYEVEVSDIGLTEYYLSKVIHCKNPFGDKLILERAEEKNPLEIIITNITGKTMYRGAMMPRETQTNINTLAWKPGIYLMKISDGNGRIFTKKLIRASDGIF